MFSSESRANSSAKTRDLRESVIKLKIDENKFDEFFLKNHKPHLDGSIDVGLRLRDGPGGLLSLPTTRDQNRVWFSDEDGYGSFNMANEGRLLSYPGELDQNSHIIIWSHLSERAEGTSSRENRRSTHECSGKWSDRVR